MNSAAPRGPPIVVVCVVGTSCVALVAALAGVCSR
jgi:hypothetical protein